MSAAAFARAFETLEALQKARAVMVAAEVHATYCDSSGSRAAFQQAQRRYRELFDQLERDAEAWVAALLARP